MAKEINILKGGINLNDSETLNQLANIYLALKISGLSQSDTNHKKKKIKVKLKRINISS